jgi:hypothetical protein
VRQDGNQLIVVATGFSPGEEVTATLYSQPRSLGRHSADAAGRIEFSWAIPADLEPGTHTLVLQGERSGQVSVSLDYASPLWNTGPAPQTGTVLGGGLLALVLGALCLGLGAARRRTT